jgi:hypothetical protein
MTGLVETIWLFVRGGESVRVIRAATPEGRNTHASHDFNDGLSAAAREAEMERELVADGYTLEQFTDRRRGFDRRGAPRPGPDRRRES